VIYVLHTSSICTLLLMLFTRAGVVPNFVSTNFFMEN
jgi:hypothetical protein